MFFKIDPMEQLISESARLPLPETPLGAAVDNLMAQWNQLLAQITNTVGHVPPTTDHIKELAEFSVRQVFFLVLMLYLCCYCFLQFKDACLELNGEFCRTATEWRLTHPEEAIGEVGKEKICKKFILPLIIPHGIIIRLSSRRG